MAFALPSFAAVASANTSGLPLQRLQDNIDFQDVKSDFATKTLTELPYKKFLTEAAMARDALSQYGATLRNKMTLTTTEMSWRPTKNQPSETPWSTCCWAAMQMQD